MIVVVAAVATAVLLLAGPVLAAPVVTLEARMNGEQEVPGRGDRDGSGDAKLIVSRAKVCYVLRVDDIRHHRMHAEYFSVPPSVADTVNRHRARGGRIVAVGTTSVRTLEYAAGTDGTLRAMEGQNDLYIYPGYRFRMVDAMITNFHLPQSTLLMLVSAFAGRDAILAAYRDAIQKNYRFFSYGDGMLIA